MLVPSTAIFKRGQLHGVFIVKPDNSAQLRWIRTGVSSGDMIEILSGINPGERIVTEGFDQLSDGQPVEVRS
jgi:multidrug efflux pump subunit AcrA (membrane-fusion protein)